jgi:hypothetical protein
MVALAFALSPSRRSYAFCRFLQKSKVSAISAISAEIYREVHTFCRKLRFLQFSAEICRRYVRGGVSSFMNFT